MRTGPPAPMHGFQHQQVLGCASYIRIHTSYASQHPSLSSDGSLPPVAGMQLGSGPARRNPDNFFLLHVFSTQPVVAAPELLSLAESSEQMHVTGYNVQFFWTRKIQENNHDPADPSPDCSCSCVFSNLSMALRPPYRSLTSR